MHCIHTNVHSFSVYYTIDSPSKILSKPVSIKDIREFDIQ